MNQPTICKTIATLSMSFILMFSILAPSMVTLLDIHIDMISYIDSSEEEKQEEIEKEVKEKDIILLKFNSSNHSFAEVKSLGQYHYAENSSSYFSEIVLPPPETIG